MELEYEECPGGGSATSCFDHKDMHVAIGSIVHLEIYSLRIRIDGRQKLASRMSPIVKSFKTKYHPTEDELRMVQHEIITIWMELLRERPVTVIEWIKDVQTKAEERGAYAKLTAIQEALGIR